MEQSYLCHLLQHKDSNILFDGRTYAIVNVGKEAVNRIKQITEPQRRSKCELGQHNPIDSEMQRLIDHKVVSRKDNVCGVSPAIRKLILVLTTACNLRCRYCFENRYESRPMNMSRNVAERCIRYLMEQSPFDEVGVHIFGGEPLLNTSLIKYIVERGKNLGIKYNKKVKFSIVTNGTKIDTEAAAFFSKHSFQVQVSVDGCQKGHDANRIFPNGDGSFGAICNNLEFLKQHNVNFTVFAVASKQLLEVDEEWFDEIDRISAGKFDFCFVVDRRPDVKPSDAIILKALESYKRYLYIRTKGYEDPKHGIIAISKFQDFIRDGRRCFYGCNAGLEEFTVMPNGDINLCERMTGTTPYNIKDNISIDRLWRNYSRSVQDEGCNECWAKYLCGGGCAHSSTVFNCGKGPVWWECTKKKIEIESAIKIIYNNLTKHIVDDNHREIK